jgi:PHD/YefM family antitoxin component YafN of YafNO toxin-antitoxin module
MEKHFTTKDVSIDDIQHQIQALITELQSGNYRFIIRQNGNPLGVLLSPDDFEDYLDLSQKDPPELQKALAESEEDYAKGQVGTLEDLYNRSEQDAGYRKCKMQ